MLQGGAWQQVIVEVYGRQSPTFEQLRKVSDTAPNTDGRTEVQQASRRAGARRLKIPHGAGHRAGGLGWLSRPGACYGAAAKQSSMRQTAVRFDERRLPHWPTYRQMGYFSNCLAALAYFGYFVNGLIQPCTSATGIWAGALKIARPDNPAPCPPR